ncbi:DUF4402 domain-containing protein [Erythrobacter sp.]|uniref:DUF4402 domain-containing protein n=1 Tax=Erythrobacter sp. TaxID=1042 RepID=UPI002EB344EC|nr:DUF4402 domain-containing protein [Erythrobacter sp.]
MALARWLIIAGAAISLPVATQAQSADNADASGTLLDQLSVTKTSALDFGTIAVTGAGTLMLAPSPSPRCEATGSAFEFRVGGTLNVGEDQAPGTYSGAFEIGLDCQ